MNEIWKPIKGFDDKYEVSSLGRVKSLKRLVNKRHGQRTIPEIILKESISPFGYALINLPNPNKNGGQSTAKVHRLVASAFIENTEGKAQINHKNGLKADNRVENLEWVSAKENQDHAVDIGLKNINIEVVIFDTITGTASEYKSFVRASKLLGISVGNISRLFNKRVATRKGLMFFSPAQFAKENGLTNKEEGQ